MEEPNILSILRNKELNLQRALEKRARGSNQKGKGETLRGPRIFRKEIDESRLKKIIAEALEICRHHVHSAYRDKEKRDWLDMEAKYIRMGIKILEE